MSAPRRMSRRQVKPRLAISVPRSNKMVMHNRRRAHNRSSRQFLRKQAQKMHRTPAGGRGRVALVPEARAPGKVVQDHLAPGTALRDHRQLPMHLGLRRQDPRREPPRHLKRPASKGNAVARSSKEAHRADRKRLFRAKSVYSCLTSMKRLALFLLVAASTSWSVCNAEDGSVQGSKDVQGNKDYGSAQTVTERTESRSVPHRAVQPSHASARNHRSWRLTRDWRISYYAHANRLPWWPGAPGN